MYDESAVKAILQRAIDLDASKAAAMTRDEVVQVASEIGISSASVHEAIQAYEAAPRPPSLDRPHQFSALRLLNLSAGAGILCGIMTTGQFVSLFDGTMIGTGIFGVLLMVSGGLALTDRSRSLASFARRNAALWLGMGFGWAASAQAAAKYGSIAGRVAFDPFRMGIVWAGLALALTTVAGSVFLVAKRVLPDSGPASGSPPNGGSRLRHAIERVRRWCADRLCTNIMSFGVVQTSAWKRKIKRPAF